MIISKPQVQDACRCPITYPKIKIQQIIRPIFGLLLKKKIFQGLKFTESSGFQNFD